MYKTSQFNLYIADNNGWCITNTLSGAVIILEKSEYEALRIGNVDYFSLDVQHALNKQGILVDSNLDEIALLRHTYFYCKYEKSEAHLTICPTLECNFACPYCYETEEHGVMNESTQEQIIFFIKNLLSKDVKILYVTWYGGEPLLCIDIIEKISMKIIELCDLYNAKYNFSMISNGYLLDEEKQNIIKNIGLSKIQITIDGMEDIHNQRRFLKDGSGTFATIVKNIRNLSNTIPIVVRVNIDRSNIESFKLVKNYFANYRNITCYCAAVTQEDCQSRTVRNQCFTHEEYKILYSNYIQDDGLFDFECGIRCCAAERLNTFVIDPRGNIYKCLNDIGHSEWQIGTLQDANHLDNEAPIAKYMGRDPFSETECYNCCFLPQCFGGCVWEYHDKGSHACRNIKFLLVERIKKKYLRKE